ncbi:filamin-binding LIM protein 1 [Bombina bombina]|uniref:filamin-binding LIM protein 1 n=1 Tax=Bombina bombina TaxID=8345 RepID=UPI00235B3099|nr:filamin-binding LIM protein 1 [Bombina bombina]
MSGKRMVSSVQITLSPPWRAETSHRTQQADPVLNTQEQRTESLKRQSNPLPPMPPPPSDDTWPKNPEFLNGDTRSFTHSFLDDIPTEEDLLSPDILPPPPPPPVLMKTPKHTLPPPPPEPPLDSLSLELEKLDLVHNSIKQKTKSVPPTAPSSLKNSTNLSSQQRREDQVGPKQSLNGISGKHSQSDICAFCHKAILPNVPTIEAMKKQYHADCFTCRKCHRLLAGQLYYQKDNQPICEHCYKDTLEKCAKCQTLILQHIVRAMGSVYHPECFTCVVCHRRIADESFAVDEYNEVHCADDYYRKYAPICSVCDQPIIPRDGQDSYKIECLGRNFHENCYRCEKCHVTLSLEPTENGCYPLNDYMLCKSCHLSWKDQLS